MQVHFTAEQEAQLAQIATKSGTDAEHLVKDVITRFLDEESRYIEAVKLGEAALERGEFLTHEQVGERLGRLLNS